MSLIVASSSQEQYGGVERTRTQTTRGIEAPMNFQNHFTSPIKIPSGASIAVESVKIRRDALVDVESQSMMYKYFGKLQTTDSEGTGWQQSRLEMPIPIRPTPGVYNGKDWQQEIEDRLNDSYGNPEIFQKYSVSQNVNGSGDIASLNIDATQRGNGAAALITSNASTMLTDYWHAPYNLSLPYAPTTNWTSTHETGGGIHKLVTRLTANTGTLTTRERLDEMGGSMIGAGSPICLVQGQLEVDVSDCAGWRVGLSRPQMEYTRDTSKTTPSRQRANLLPGTRHPEAGDGSAVASTKYNMRNPFNGRPQKDFYDYMVQDDGVSISVYQLSYDDTFGTEQLVQSEVVYWGYVGAINATQITSAGFNASFTTVKFETEGDEVKLSFLTGAGVATLVVGQAQATLRYHSFLPISENRNALYPRLNIGSVNDTMKIENYTSHWALTQATDQTVFRFPTYDDTTKTFTTGDDFYSNNRVGRFQRGKIGGDPNMAIIRDTKDRPYCLSQTLICDTKDRMVVDQSHASTAQNSWDNELAGNAGVDKQSAYIIGWNKPLSTHDYLEGKYMTAEWAGQPKMNRTIGFPERGFIDQVDGLANGPYVSIAAGGATVNFNSWKAPDYRVHSAFVRISNLPIQSYNGAKTSVSKILYHLPRFTNDGREYGDLFFAPGEKTYVALHNTTPEILNNIEIQIVDVNERPVEDISGNTIVVFHLK